jgi:hypothetical protein
MSKKPKTIIKYSVELISMSKNQLRIYDSLEEMHRKRLLVSYNQAVKAIPHVERLIAGLRKSAGK